MEKQYTVEKMSGTRSLYTFTEKNDKGELIQFELTACMNDGDKNYLGRLWKKNGYIDRVLPSYICVNTYVTAENGDCAGYYNPQHKRSDDGKRRTINFDWMLEATEENTQKLIDEIYRLATA